MFSQSTNPVKALYTFANAKWYDPFLHLWNPLVASQAESYFLSFLKSHLTSESQILELGCGTADNVRLIMEHQLPFKSYLGLDFTPSMLVIAREKWSQYDQLSFQEMDLTQLETLTGKYDLIICTWVLSHIPQPAQLVNQAQEYLNSNGKAFFLFLTKPLAHINWWLSPFVHHLFNSQYVPEQEIRAMQNIQERLHFSQHLITTLVIGQTDEVKAV